jgi:hypothetical protein
VIERCPNTLNRSGRGIQAETTRITVWNRNVSEPPPREEGLPQRAECEGELDMRFNCEKSHPGRSPSNGSLNGFQNPIDASPADAERLGDCCRQRPSRDHRIEPFARYAALSHLRGRSVLRNPKGWRKTMRLLIVGGMLALAFFASLTPASARCSTLRCVCRAATCGDIPRGTPSPTVEACIRKCVATKKAAQH